jgi:signal transduction histidine kinase/PAS domain-containing protein
MDEPLFNLLLVDPNDNDCKIIRNAFNSYFDRCVISAAHSVSDARDCLNSNTYNIIILNAALSGDDGTAFLRTLKKAPVIAMIDPLNKKHAADPTNAGAVTYVVKTKAVMRKLPELADQILAENNLNYKKNCLNTNVSEQYKNLYYSMEEGIVLHEIIFDGQGTPIDYVIVDVNPSYEKILCIKRADAIGKYAADLYNSPTPPYLDLYSRVVQTGQPTSFDTYYAPMKKYFSISVFKIDDSEFATVFKDVTSVKHMFDQMKHRTSRLKSKLDKLLSAQDSLDFFSISDITNIDELQKIQDIFSQVTNVASVIVDNKGNRITSPSNECQPCYNYTKTPTACHGCPLTRYMLNRNTGTNNEYTSAFEPYFDREEAPIVIAGKEMAKWIIGKCILKHADENLIQKISKKKQITIEEVIAQLTSRNNHHQIPFEKIKEFLWLLAKEISTLGYNNLTLAKELENKKIFEQERDALIHELEEKNKELQQFAYAVSHDLKSPLITVQGYLGLIKRNLNNESIEQFNHDLSRISNAVSKMQMLLDDLLELSRVGSVNHDIESFSLTDVVYEAIELVQGRILERNVTVTVDPSLPEIIGDRVRIMQLFQNLIDNAVKFIGDTERPLIEIGYQEIDNQPCVFVRDNGIGIAVKDQSKIFELFTKLDPDSSGTGIGLTLVKRIVEMHDGTIWYTSEGAGKGSTFYIAFPVENTTNHL